MRTRLTLLSLAFGILSIAGARAQEATIVPSVKLDRVEVVGVSQIEPLEVENSVELSEGDMLSREAVVRSAENIQRAYRTRGYDRVRVKSELVREPLEAGGRANVLRFTVTETKPSILKRVLITQASGGTMTPAQFEALRSKLAPRFALMEGGPLLQDRVEEMRQVLLAELTSEQYVGSRNIETKTSFEEGEVVLELIVSPGERVVFGFRGNEALTSLALSMIVDDMRMAGLGADYVSAVASRVSEEYRSIGYDTVTVKPFTFESNSGGPRRVSFEIKEGPLVKIASITFDGERAFSDLELTEQLKRLSAASIKREIYVARDVDRAGEALIDWIKTRGFLGAKLVTIIRAPVVGRSARALTFYVYEGDQTRVRSVRIAGAAAYTNEEILDWLGHKENDPINLVRLNEGIERIKARYRARGFIDFKILNEGLSSLVTYSQDNRLADLYLEFSEGPAFVAGTIRVEGLTKTDADIVTRELRIVEGEPLEESRILETESALRRLGIFSSAVVRLEESPTDSNRKDVVVVVTEGTPGVIAGGLGFRNDLGARVFGQIGYGNIWGRNHSTTFNLTANRRFDEEFCSNQDTSRAPFREKATGSYCGVEAQAQVGYAWPWFGLKELMFRPRLTAERTQFRRFDQDAVAITPAWERNLVQNPHITGVFSYSLERIKQFNAQDAQDNQALTIGSVTPSLYLDLRDNRLAPTRGLFTSASYEIADPIFLSQSNPDPVGYHKFQFRSDFFIPLPLDLQTYFSFRTGHVRNTKGPAAAIPLSKQFTLGGVGSLRGFREQELSFSRQRISGSMSYVNYRGEISVPVSGPLRFGPFLDAANLLINDFSFGKVRFGAGFGFHYVSPVGPVNFDWGFKLDPRPNEDREAFYFSIGVI